ncbi:MAG: S8 family serine peptidase, partial [Acidimicrobiia bacterium]
MASGPGQSSDSPEPSNYIVSLRAEPLASFAGDSSLAATSPRMTGRKLDPTSRDAVEYRRRLDALEARVLRAAGVPNTTVGYRYRTTLTGFSARLTAAEAQRLRQRPEVASVTADRTRTVPHRRPAMVTPEKPMHHAALARAAATAGAAGPAPTAEPVPEADLSGQPAEFFDLPEGLWARLGGPDKAGEGVVIGFIDGGIYPEHPSFADEPVAADGSHNYIGPAYGPPPATWRGICQEGEAWPATTCTNKLIGARYFVDGLGVEKVAEQEFLSPRDVEGHGTGTASIAAGNYGIDPSYLGNDLGVGVISGIAPRARIAHYKAFWAAPAADAGIAAESDLVAAIDTAVADGIDVLSYAIGGELGATLPISDQSTMLDAESQAMLRAFDAGVLPVLVAGNSGPDPDTVEAPGHTPWVISAGASGLPVTYAATATVSG